MSAVGPPGPSVQTPGDSSSQVPPLSWEGDRMFNIYIYDYCFKRGFLKTARELLLEAEIPIDSMPPINARQGLLFEWWSVFWVLFGAKSNGIGPDDAMLYVQHQQHQAAQRQAQQRPQAQIPMGRFMNAMPRQPGMMVNGAGPPMMAGQPPGQGSVSFPMSGAGPQPNGIPSHVGGHPGPGGPGQPSSFQTLMPGQRPPLQGMQQQPQQQRAPNGMPPFQSPTMAHSPSGGSQQHAQPPLTQMGPSPHLAHMNRGGMLPPNGPQGMNAPGSMVSAPNPVSTQPYQQLGRSPSRAGTPGGQNSMTQPSPSFAARQIPGGDVRQFPQEQILNMELRALTPGTLQACMQEAGVGDKNLQSCKLEEKQRVWSISKRRNPGKPGPPGPHNGGAGPNQMQPLNQQRNQPQQAQRGNKRNSTSPGEEHEIVPKTESSPPDRKRPRRSPISADQASMTQMSYPVPPQGPGVPQQMPNGMMRGPMGNQPMNGFPSQSGIPNMAGNPNMSIPLAHLGVPQLGAGATPGVNHPGPGGMMTGQMNAQMHQQLAAREAQYRQNMHNMQKGAIPPGVMSNALPTAGSPSSTDPTFMAGHGQGPGPQFPATMGPTTRMTPNKSMMPPPSPGMNGPKDQAANKDGKSGNLNPQTGLPDDPLRNALNPGQPGQLGQNMGTITQGGTNTAPVPNQGLTAPSPSAILSNPTSISLAVAPTNAPDAMPPNMFSTDFMSVANSLEDLDTTIFRSDSDINFERDFGQWFNPDDVANPLDMK